MKNIFLYLASFILLINLFPATITILTTVGEETINLSEIENITIEGAVTDIDGNVYQTITIGNQEWMIENLKVTHYRNGDPIPTGHNNSDWTNLSTGAYCVFENDPANAALYGNLYNWYAVDDPREIAPVGWHIPTDGEIIELEMYLGMSEIEANDFGSRGTNEGSKLAGEADLWQDGALENNTYFGTSGLNWFPGGYRYYADGIYSYMGLHSYFWSSTENAVDHAWYRFLDYNFSEISRYGRSQKCGFSLRCVKN